VAEEFGKPEELLQLKRVISRSGQCRTGIYTDPTFPRPIKIGKRASVWIASEVDKWIADRIREARGLSANARVKALRDPGQVDSELAAS
jgi:prophage regulatory protein